MENVRKIFEMAAGQHGVISRRQMSALGATEGQRRWLVSTGQLIALGPQSFRVLGAPANPRQRILGACMDSGGVAACRTGSRLHGIGGFSPPELPEVLVERPSGDVRIDTARVHSTRWLPEDDIVTVDGLPTLGVARCLLSLAALAPRELSADRVKGAVHDAISQGKASDTWLWWHLERTRRRGRNGVAVMEQILKLRDGGEVTESWLERETLRLIGRFGLPAPVCQERVERRGAFVARVDFAYPAERLVIEVSGYRWHRTKAQMASDLRRRRELTLLGYRVLEYGYDDIVASPERVAAEIAEALSLSAAA